MAYLLFIILLKVGEATGHVPLYLVWPLPVKMVRFARHGTNEVCGVKCKSSVFYGTKLSNPQSSSIGEMYRGNKLEGISLPQAASRFSSRNLQIEKNQFQI